MIKIINKSEETKGIIAMILFTFFGALMGVWVRELGMYFSSFEQIFIRSLVEFFLAFILYIFILKRVDKKIFKISKQDLFFIILRGSASVLAIWSFVVAISLTKMANVSLLLAVPTTALFGVLFLKEKMNFKKIFFLSISIFGAFLILINNLNGHFSFGEGEIYALISSISYSFAGLFRKKISNNVNNETLSAITLLLIIIGNFLLMIFSGENFDIFVSKIPATYPLIILAGITLVAISWLISYSYQKLNLITANNMEFLEIFFALLIGYFVYSETPIFREIIGGGLIVLGAYLMVKYKDK